LLGPPPEPWPPPLLWVETGTEVGRALEPEVGAGDEAPLEAVVTGEE
jgi:hypothetical protein